MLKKLIVSLGFAVGLVALPANAATVQRGWLGVLYNTNYNNMVSPTNLSIGNIIITNGSLVTNLTEAILGLSGNLNLTTGLGITNIVGTGLSNNIVAGSNVVITAGSYGQLTIASTATGGVTNPTNLYQRVNVGSFSPDRTGATDTTAAFTSAQAALLALSPAGGIIDIPEGTYKINFASDSRVSLVGAGKRATYLTPATASIPVLYRSSFGVSTNAEFSTLSDFTIDLGHGVGSIGLYLGTNTVAGSNSRNVFRDITIINADTYGIYVRDATSCLFQNVMVSDCAGGTGLYLDNERNAQLCQFISCQFRQNKIGANLASGNRFSFIGCDFESNTDTGLYVNRTITSGLANSIFQSCWFENNGYSPTVTNTATAQIYLDGNAAYGLTNAANLLFSYCVIAASTLTNSYDISADRAQNVIFDHCSLTATNYGGFSTNKLRFSTGTGAVFATFIQCGELNRLPTTSDYALWPALSTSGTGGSTLGLEGFVYKITYLGREYSNLNPFGIAGSPSGVLLPYKIGELVKDTSNGLLYLSKGLTTSDWVLLGGVTDGDKGDITVTSNGSVWTIDNDAITTVKVLNNAITKAKFEGIGAGKVLGRAASLGVGNVTEMSVTGGGALVVLNDTPTLLTARADSITANYLAYNSSTWQAANQTNLPTMKAIAEKIENVVTNTGVGVTNISGVLSANLAAGSNITFTTNSNGQVSIAGASGGVAGTVINTIASTAGQIAIFSDTTKTNIQPSSALTNITLLTSKFSHTWLASNNTYTGIDFQSVTNSGGVTQWDLVYLNSSGQVLKADADGSGTYPAWGLAASTASTGNTLTIVLSGTVRNDSWTWTPGGDIYMSTTAGGLTQTIPTTSLNKQQKVGRAITATQIWFNPGQADYFEAP